MKKFQILFQFEVLFFAVYDAFFGEKVRSRVRNIFGSKMRVHPHAVTCPESMRVFAHIVKKYTTIKPRNVFEIGANFAQDAEGLRHYFGLADENVWVFEAHPDMCREIEKMYKFNCINGGVFNKQDTMTFNAVDLGCASNNGLSSLKGRIYRKDFMRKITVDTFRMDDFMRENNIDGIDFLKIDVEGANYEVLEGFGDRLKDIKALHIECEHKLSWDDQKLYVDNKKLLVDNGFEKVFFQRRKNQSDSFWVRREYIKI